MSRLIYAARTIMDSDPPSVVHGGLSVMMTSSVTSCSQTSSAHRQTTYMKHELVIAYDVTLSSLLDVHAPYRVIRRSTRPFQVWYDSDCRIARASSSTLSYNCLTRHLEEPVLHPATSLLPESDRLLEENDCRVRWRCTAALV